MGEEKLKLEDLEKLMCFLKNSSLKQRKELLEKIRKKIRAVCISHLSAILSDLSLIKASREGDFEKFRGLLEARLKKLPEPLKRDLESVIKEICCEILEKIPEEGIKKAKSDNIVCCIATGRILREEEIEEIVINEEACNFLKEKLREIHKCIEEDNAERYLKILQEIENSIYINIPEVEMIVNGYYILYVYLFSRRLERAEEAFNKVYAELYEVRSMMYPQALETWLKRLLALYLHLKGDFERSNMICNELLLLEENPSIRASLINLMSWNYEALGQPKKAAESLNRLFQIPTHAIHPYMEALRLLRGSIYYFNKGELEKARKLCEEGLRISKRFGYNGLAERLEYNLMILRRVMGEFGQVKEFFKRDLEKELKQKDYIRAMISLYNLIEVCMDEGSYEEALKYVEKYEPEILPNVASKSHLLAYKICKADLLARSDKVEEAIRIINEVVPEIAGIRELEARVYQLMGRLLAKSEDYDKAMNYLMIARSYQELSENFLGVLDVLLDTIEICLEKTEKKKDLTTLKTAEALLKEAENMIKEKKCFLYEKKYKELLNRYNTIISKFKKEEGERWEGFPSAKEPAVD